MKEFLHKSSPVDQSAGRRVITDVDAVRAMAHPHRVAILQFLLSGPPRTATECASEVGGTPSACSYHLRELEQFGLVERVVSDGDSDGDENWDRRTRPWRAAAIGYSIGSEWIDDSPASQAAASALGRADLVENQRLFKRHLDTANSLDADWRSASEHRSFEVMVNPDELRELSARIAELLLPYRVPVRSDPPSDAAAVHVVYQAFPRPAT